MRTTASDDYICFYFDLGSGSTVVIQRVVTATTSQITHENDVPKVEVHISPATETVIPPPPSHEDDIYQTSTFNQHSNSIQYSNSYNETNVTTQYRETHNTSIHNEYHQSNQYSQEHNENEYNTQRGEIDYDNFLFKFQYLHCKSQCYHYVKR